jgi:demethylmenaquinone methyltransferase / 2-methoxy-6-polyprenyl-1,4-benzoquinol methylase
VSESKRDRVRAMFGRVAKRYDWFNSVLSMGLHHGWRRFAVRECEFPPGGRALDVAVGTGDFAIETIKAGGTAVGVDVCEPMLQEGRRKLERLGLERRIRLVVAEAEALPVPSDSFDSATIGFALRNVTDVDQTFAEMARAVRPGGKVVGLEITRPQNPILRWLFSFYFYRLSPWIARLLGGDAQAYQYLPNSVRTFKTREELCESMRRAGLVDVHYHDLSGGMICVHVGTKPGNDAATEAQRTQRRS